MRIQTVALKENTIHQYLNLPCVCELLSVFSTRGKLFLNALVDEQASIRRNEIRISIINSGEDIVLPEGEPVLGQFLQSTTVPLISGFGSRRIHIFYRWSS